jgi:hypothetical protein
MKKQRFHPVILSFPGCAGGAAEVHPPDHQYQRLSRHSKSAPDVRENFIAVERLAKK